MRSEVLKKLLAQSRLKSAPKTIISKSTLNSLIYLGVSDEALIKFVIPKIIDLEHRGECSIKNLKHFIQAHPEIEILADPTRHIINNSQIQRRMDSLSRLLSLDTKFTVCVAVTFFKGELIASSNSPKAEITEDLLAGHISKKMGLIQDFLMSLLKNIPIESQPDIEKIQFSARAKLLATDTVLKITHSNNGGVGDVIPNFKANRHKKRLNTNLHLQNALLKLGEYCLLGVLSNGKKGFTLEEISALFNTTITIITPNTQVMKEKQLHAEQSILYYLNELTDFSTDPSAQAHIGISRLCCQACHSVLSREDKLTYRGTHGIKFSSVFDISTLSLFEGTPTNMKTDPFPEDSDSEYESYSDDDIELPKTEIPSVETFIPEDERSFGTQPSNFTLFKPFKQKIVSLGSDKSDAADKISMSCGMSTPNENILF